MMSKLFKVCFILTVFIIASCSTDEDAGVSMESPLIKSYLFDTSDDYNVLAIDVHATDDGGWLVFGVGGRLSSRLDATGSLYVQKINENGETAWKHFYNEIDKGFPVNVIENQNGYLLFWNYEPGVLKTVQLTGDFTSQASITISDASLGGNVVNKYIIDAIAKPDNSGFLLLGIGSDPESDTIKKTHVLELNSSLDYVSEFAAQEYTSKAFGSFGNEDFALLQKLNRYFHLSKNLNESGVSYTYFFNAPFNSKIALKFIGDEKTLYSDTEHWVLAIEDKEPKKISLLVSNPNAPGGEVYFIPEILLQPYINPDFANLQQYIETTLHGFDIDKQIIMRSFVVEENSKLLIAGTSLQGQIILYIYNGPQDMQRMEIGQASDFKVTDIVESGDDLVIVGTSTISDKYPRVYMIKLPKDQLMNIEKFEI